MSEILFILTVIYVAYVVYKVADSPKVETRENTFSSAETVITPSGIVPMEAVIVPEAEPVAMIEEVDIKSSQTNINSLRHPETGEIAKVSNNYRGLKRWLKEALVTEGLLEKVYSNSELNDETNAKIKQAIETLKTLPQYQV